MGSSNSRNEDSGLLKLPDRKGEEWVKDIVTGSRKLRQGYRTYLASFKIRRQGLNNPQEFLEAYYKLKRAYTALQGYHDNCTDELRDKLFNVVAYQLAQESFTEMDRYMTPIRYKDHAKHHTRMGEIVDIHVNAGIVAKKLPKSAFLSYDQVFTLEDPV